MKRTRWLLWILGVLAGYVGVVRPWHLGWGATGEERRARLPGDDLVPVRDLQATRAIWIRADASEVWPWIAQMGQGRGGLYSYDALENLIGCDIHSADRIVPRWQDVRAGDPFRLHPEVALQVAEVDATRALVIHGAVAPTVGSAPFDFSWAFVLQDDRSGTRLVVRERYGYARPWAWLLVEPVEAISFLMSQKMLRGIRDRAESRIAA